MSNESILARIQEQADQGQVIALSALSHDDPAAFIRAQAADGQVAALSILGDAGEAVG